MSSSTDSSPCTSWEQQVFQGNNCWVPSFKVSCSLHALALSFPAHAGPSYESLTLQTDLDKVLMPRHLRFRAAWQLVPNYSPVWWSIDTASTRSEQEKKLNQDWFLFLFMAIPPFAPPVTEHLKPNLFGISIKVIIEAYLEKGTPKFQMALSHRSKKDFFAHKDNVIFFCLYVSGLDRDPSEHNQFSVCLHP